VGPTSVRVEHAAAQTAIVQMGLLRGPPRRYVAGTISISGPPGSLGCAVSSPSHHHQPHPADHRPSVPARVATGRRSRRVGSSSPSPPPSRARLLPRTSVRMDAPRRVQLLPAMAAVVVAAVAAVAAAIPAGESCACALADATTVGRCMTFVASTLGSSVGVCTGKDCEPSFECVDVSVATHMCQSRAVQTVSRCMDGTTVGAGILCACQKQRSTAVTLSPTS